MITYVYPPIAYGGTYRSLRLSKYLSRLNYEITVLTIKRQNDLQNDDDLLAELPSSVTVERTMTVDPWRSYQKVKDRLQASSPGKILAKILSAVLFIINKPDHMIFWVPFAVWRGRKLIREKNIKVIYTSTPPHSGQMIGYLLKKMTGVKWIADLRDPILGNLGGVNWGWYERTVHAWLERLVCHRADHVVANTEYVRNYLASRYPNCLVSTVRNCFDPDDFIGPGGSGAIMFTIDHIGSLYFFRKIDSILEALEVVVAREKLSPDDIRLRLVGLKDKRIVDQIVQSKVSRYVSVEDMVPHARALQIMTESNLLLLIKGSGSDSGAQIPGKLYEYLGSGNKILYLGPADTEAAEIIRENEAGYIVENDIHEIATVLHCEFTAWRKGIKTSSFSENSKIEQFSARKMAEKFDHLIQSVY
jgi:hypothetical protein